jgi:hypothetical protein
VQNNFFPSGLTAFPAVAIENHTSPNSKHRPWSGCRTSRRLRSPLPGYHDLSLLLPQKRHTTRSLSPAREQAPYAARAALGIVYFVSPFVKLILCISLARRPTTAQSCSAFRTQLGLNFSPASLGTQAPLGPPHRRSLPLNYHGCFPHCDLSPAPVLHTGTTPPFPRKLDLVGIDCAVAGLRASEIHKLNLT